MKSVMRWGMVAIMVTLINFARADDAPTSLGGKSAVVVISDGGGVFASIGAYRITFSTNNTTYTVSPLSWNISASAGTFVYTKTSASTGTLSIRDTAVGTVVAMPLIFTAPTTASYSIGGGTNFQRGTAVWENVTVQETIIATGDRLVNMSVRAWIKKGGLTIPGFVLDKPTKVLVRVAGPGLGAFGVSPVVANPSLELVSQSNGSVIATNDDWSSDASEKRDIEAAGEASGAFKYLSGSKDAAVIRTLQPGAYTAVIKGAANDEGEVLLEVYRVP